MFLTPPNKIRSIKTRQINYQSQPSIRERDACKKFFRHTSQAETYPTKCQYPVRDATKRELLQGSDDWKCLAGTKPESSYCEHHHAQCYVKVVLTDAE